MLSRTLMRLCLGAVFSALALIAAPAFADYVCKPVDVPDSKWTQLMQLNNAGQIVAGSDIGGAIYSGGSWTPLPDPPAATGFTRADLGALGINDSGVIAGAASTDAVLEQGFILSGNTYTFFTSGHPGWYTEARSISNSGIV